MILLSIFKYNSLRLSSDRYNDVADRLPDSHIITNITDTPTLSPLKNTNPPPHTADIPHRLPNSYTVTYSGCRNNIPDGLSYLFRA